MARVYTTVFENVAVSAAQDLVQVKGAAGKIVKIKRVFLGMTDTTLQTAQGLQLRARYLPSVVTDGSGGTSPSFLPQDPGDAAASVTAKVNNTTKATTSGTAVILEEWGVHNFAGLDYTWPTGSEPTIGPSESFVFELLSTVTGTCHFSGSCRVEESGG
jgi:hypothetical protein